jgi:DNA-entry nuclease
MKRFRILPIILGLCLILCSCSEISEIQNNIDSASTTITEAQSIPASSGNDAYTVLNNNIPEFTEDEYTTSSFEEYGELDNLGRCTAAFACIGQDIMPTEKRGSIGNVKPTGWHTVKYSNVDGNYLYNRCHLIAYELSAENANEQNLITGTRYMNINGMLPFENMVADYVKTTGNHVLYRVRPVFNDDELVARGVQMEGYSVEDNGDGICFNVYCYNIQPGITIDYATGDSSANSDENTFDDGSTKKTYIVNTNSKKFHSQDCSSAEKIKEENKKTYTGDRENLIKNGYSPCSQCNP